MSRLRDGCRIAGSLTCVACGLTLAACAGDPAGTEAGGSLIVRTTTTGGAFDPDGFVVVIDGDSAGIVDVNSGRYFSLPEGIHSVALAGMAPNCLGGDAREVMVRAGARSEVEIEAACVPTPELAGIRILFAGKGGIVAMDADGSDRITLVPGTEGTDFDSPDISADGARLAFARRAENSSELWVAEPDGTGRTQLAAGFVHDPRWSPDGGEIAYTNSDGSGNGGIRVTRLADTLTERLTDAEDFIDEWHRWPSWSPDGSRIVFDAGGSLAIVGTDGTLDYLGPGTFPAWSREGRIGYVGRDGSVSKDIKVIQADGTGDATLLPTRGGSLAQPRDWSPDGRLLLYTDVISGVGTDVYLLDVEHGTTVRVTGDGSSTSPVFWPHLD